MRDFFGNMGYNAAFWMVGLSRLFTLFGAVLNAFIQGLYTKGIIQPRHVFRQIVLMGVDSVGIICLVCAAVGMVLALQGGYQLDEFGATMYTGSLVSISVLRELGPLVAAIVITGRVGARVAAELGTMAVSEEIDALTVMSIDPVRFLVMPRLVSLALVCPLLTIYVDVVGILGGGVVSHAVLGVDIQVYGRNAWDVLEMKDVYGGLFKSLLFGCLIASVGCGQGLRARNGAEGVGRNTMRSVVNSLIFILMFDYFVTWALY